MALQQWFCNYNLWFKKYYQKIIFNDNNEFNGANRFTYNNYSYGSTNLDIVGIGTTLPSIAISTGPAYVFTNDAILDIRGDIRLEGTVYDSNDKDATTKDDDTGDLLIRGENGLIWKDQAGLNVSAGGTVPGQIQFRGLTGLLDGATNFFFDDANDRVGIGTTLPNFTFEVIGDVGIANSLTVNDIVSIAKTVSIASTAENIPGNTGTGALVVTGGVGIGGSVSVGGSITAAGGFTLVGGLEVEDTTTSTSVTTGALIVAGGAGIGGDLNVGGDIIAYAGSDLRLKTDINPIADAVNKVKSLRGVTYEWNENSDYEGQLDIGVIAQEVDALGLPGLIQERDNGYLAVRYERLVPLLIEAIKELSDKVDSLEERLNN